MNRLARFHRNHPCVFPAAAILALMACTYTLIPLGRIFEFSTDEGTNTMKSVLLLRGYPLYGSIWSDQPPVFTSLLAAWFKIFGTSILAARTLALCFSGLLLFGLYQTIRKLNGELAAVLACVFLIFSANFARLGVSVMIGLPAIALAVASLYTALRHTAGRSRTMLFASAILFAVSLQTKFFTAILLPMLLLAVKNNRTLQQSAQDMAWWVGASLAAYALITLSFFYRIPAEFIPQLFAPHLQQLHIPHNDFSLISRQLTRDFDLVLLAAAAVVVGGWRKSLLPLAWLGGALLVLGIYRPLWFHYYPLISLPVSWMAGSGCAFMAKKKGFGKFFLLFLAAAIIAIALPLKTVYLANSVSEPDRSAQKELVGFIAARRSAGWILCDSPIYCFYAGIPCPPEIALISPKRRLTKPLAEYLVRKYKPKLVVLAKNNSCDQEAIQLLKNTYPAMRTINIKQENSWTETGCYTTPSRFIPRKILRCFRKTVVYKGLYSQPFILTLPRNYHADLEVRIFENAGQPAAYRPSDSSTAMPALTRIE